MLLIQNTVYLHRGYNISRLQSYEKLQTNNMAKQILLPVPVKAEMLESFKVSRMTLYRALMYAHPKSPQENMLRAAAIQRGGRIFTGQVAEPEVQHVVDIFRETCPRRLDQSCTFHDACDMSCRHGRAFQSRLLIKK